MKRHTPFVVALAVPVLIASQAARSPAQDTDALSIHGFGGWAAGYTNNGNLYPDTPGPLASEDFEVDNYYFTLNLLARPAERVVVHAQPTWESDLNGNRMKLDLAYVELTLVKDVRVRAGKIRNPLGLYTAIFKVGTLRPFYLLPNAYYRQVPEGYAGLGLNRVQALGSWELELDLLGGQMNFDPTDLDMIVGFNPETQQPVFASVPAALRGRDMVGGGILLRTPVTGLQIGGSMYSMKLYASLPGQPTMRIDEGEGQKAYSASLEYLTDKVSLRSEALFLRGFEEANSWYVEGAYNLTDHWQMAASYQTIDISEPPPIVASLSKDAAFGAALNYWLNPKLVWKLNYYRVKDNRAARPSDAVNAALSGTLEDETDVIIAGVHFSF